MTRTKAAAPTTAHGDKGRNTCSTFWQQNRRKLTHQPSQRQGQLQPRCTPTPKRNTSWATRPAGLRARRGYEQRTETEKDDTRGTEPKLIELVRKIFGAMQADLDDKMLPVQLVPSALAFCMFSIIKERYDLPSDREACEFCAKYIKTYAQVVFS